MTGMRTAVQETGRSGRCSDLARLDDDLPLLLGVAVIAEDVDVRQRVEGDLVRIDGGLQWLPRGPGTDLVLQLRHGLVAGAADGLVGIHDDARDAGAVAQGLEQRHQLHGGAIGVGDDALVVRRVLVVHASDHQRHARLHAPLRGVVDHGGATSHGFGGEDLGDAATGREDGHVDAIEGRRRGHLDRPGATAELHAATVRPRRQRTELADREGTLSEDLDHGPAHEAGGADDSDGEGSAGGLDGHVCIPIGLPSRARRDDTSSRPFSRGRVRYRDSDRSHRARRARPP